MYSKTAGGNMMRKNIGASCQRGPKMRFWSSTVSIPGRRFIVSSVGLHWSRPSIRCLFFHSSDPISASGNSSVQRLAAFPPEGLHPCSFDHFHQVIRWDMWASRVFDMPHAIFYSTWLQKNSKWRGSQKPGSLQYSTKSKYIARL